MDISQAINMAYLVICAADRPHTIPGMNAHSSRGQLIIHYSMRNDEKTHG